jgi:anthraniloyl-CoA monooxygenase
MAAHSHRWDDIEIHYRGTTIASTGHGFSGLSRRTLLAILADRCRGLDVDLRFQCEVTDPGTLRGADLVLAADGVNSLVRERFAEQFQPAVTRPTVRVARHRPAVPGLHLLFQARRARPVAGARLPVRAGRLHVHRRGARVDLARGRARSRRRGRDHRLLRAAVRRRAARTPAALQPLDLAQLPHGAQRALVARQRVVLVGDAAHTHFSVGSGTKLAMEDAVALAAELRQHGDVPAALAAYEEARRPAVESLQRAAQVSLQWFEDTERYMDLEPLQFTFTLLTRSLRITHGNLKTRDPTFVARVDAWFAERHAARRRPRAPGARRRRCSRRSACGPGHEPHRGLAHVPVHRPGRDAERLAPRHLGSRAMGGAGCCSPK